MQAGRQGQKDRQTEKDRDRQSGEKPSQTINALSNSCYDIDVAGK